MDRPPVYCGDQRQPVHSARVGDTGEIHYAWHPLVGERVPIVYTEHRRGELVAICEMPHGSRAIVPVWMLDWVACATLSVGPPRCSLAALCNLRSLLDALGFHGWAPSQVRDGQEDDRDHKDDRRPPSDTAAATVSTPGLVAIPGGRDARCGRTAPGSPTGQRVHTRRESRGTR